MKRLMLLISAILTLSGCSNSNERASINLSIEEYEAKIEEEKELFVTVENLF